MIDFMLKEDYKYIIWVTHASPTHIHTIHVGIIDFVVVFVGHAHARRALHFHGKILKSVLKNDVTASCSPFLAFFILTMESGSGAAQLPHEHFKLKKASA